MKKIVFSLLLPFLFLAGHAKEQPECPEVLPTLEAYMLRAHGDPSRMVWPAIPKDGPVCEKLRRDRKIYLCRVIKSEARELKHRRQLKRMRHSLDRYRKSRPEQVGGNAAKQRSLTGLTRNVTVTEGLHRKAQADLARSGPILKKVDLELESLGCRFSKRDPYLKRYGVR